MFIYMLLLTSAPDKTQVQATSHQLSSGETGVQSGIVSIPSQSIVSS